MKPSKTSSNKPPQSPLSGGGPMNFAGKITHAFLHNRPLSYLVFFAIILAGVFSYFATPKQYNPEITLPAFEISVEYPGATAEEVEHFVTYELEEKLAEIPGVDTISSRSIDGGMAIVTVEFFIGEDLEESKVKVQSQLSANADLAVAGMGQPIIKTINPDNVPILTFGFVSDRLPQNEMRSKVIDVMNDIRGIPNIANLDVHGGEPRALRILLDPAKMKLRKISAADIRQALLASNTRLPVGDIESFHSREEIEVRGSLLSQKQAKEILVAPGIKLSDVAIVDDAYREKVSYTQVSKNTVFRDAVFLSVAKKKGENAVTVSEEVRSKMRDLLAQEKYQDLQMEVFRDDGKVASEAVGGLFQNLITSIAIVSLVLFFFLGGRSALVVSLAIPLSLALTFFVGYLVGETINRITLFALILSLGLLVDSATVVVENIYRHLQKHENKKTAITTAVNEVGIGLFLSTITSVIVFLPTSQISGMMGEYMGPLSFFVPVTLVMALLVAYKITPFLADVLFTRSGSDNPGFKLRIFGTFNFFDRLSNLYARLLRRLLSKRKNQIRFLGIVFFLFFLVLLFPVLELVHFRMLPTADKEQYYVYVDAPEGTNHPQTQKVTKKLIELLSHEEESQSFQSFVGEAPVVDFNGLYKGAHLRTAPHLATVRVNLTHPDDRSISSEDIVIRDRQMITLDKTLASYMNDGWEFRLIEEPPGPPVAATLQAKVKGKDREIRGAIANDLLKKYKQTDGVVDMYTSIEAAYPKILFEVHHEKALASGVTTAQIADALASSLDPLRIDQFHAQHQNEISFLEMQFDTSEMTQVQDLSEIYIKNTSGEMLPLGSIVQAVESRNEPVRYRDEHAGTTYVNAELEKRSVVYAVIDLLFDLNDYQLPDGGTLESWNLFGLHYRSSAGELYSIEWGGEWKMTLENFRDLGLAMVVAFVLIYAVLVAQFRSFSAPGLVMTTIPLGFLGIMPGFALLDLTAGTFLTATSLIGFVALMGIVVNNAILYLEYFDQLREKGIELREALVEAGRVRLRPIMLTSITTVLGTLTIAGDPVWSGLAWAIVFGLSLSVLMTLGVFPVLYYLVKPKR